METVYISNSLERYPLVYQPLITNLQANGIEIKILDTPNIWTRDYMPIQTRNGFIKFKYKTLGYDKWPQLKIDTNSNYWRNVFSKFNDLIYTDIILDGGNCQMNPEKDVAVITDIIFKNNPEYKEEDLINRLSNLLQAKIIIIPRELGDELGHADGIVKFVSRDCVFLNVYSEKSMIKYREKVEEILNYSGIKTMDFPNFWLLRPKMSPNEFRKKYPYADDFNPAWGYAINFLKINKLVAVPVFNIKQDAETVNVIKKYYHNCGIVTIDCSDLSMEGGLLNCVTREYNM